MTCLSCHFVAFDFVFLEKLTHIQQAVISISQTRMITQLHHTITSLVLCFCKIMFISNVCFSAIFHRFISCLLLCITRPFLP